jgi:dienelactone hydrolase
MHEMLTRYERFELEGGGTGEVYCIENDGPGVIILHELPGMTPQCLDLGIQIADAGFSVYLPLLFGEAGEQLGAVRQICILRKWNRLAKREATPMTDWIRALGREVHRRCGGAGIGAIGMCLTGGFIIPLLLDEHLLAPVSSQPALPWGFRKAVRSSLGFCSEKLEGARRRVEEKNLTILGFRYESDGQCPAEKFDTMESLFGDRFERIDYPGRQHSVLTKHRVPDAVERTISFLRSTLEADRPPAESS